MIGPSEKSGIEIESGYQLTGHPVYARNYKTCNEIVLLAISLDFLSGKIIWKISLGLDGGVPVEKKQGGGWKVGKEGNKKYISINFTYHTETFLLDHMVEGLI